MDPEYSTQRTSRWTAQVEDVQISTSKNPDSERTRRVVRMELVDNAKDSAACVKLTLLNQKRHSTKEPWQDPEFFNAAKLKAGEQIRFTLTASQARRLFNALRDMYELGSDGLPEGSQNLRVVNADDTYVVTGKRTELISRLIESEGGKFFGAVSELEPDLFENAAFARFHRRRRDAVESFESELQRQKWSEHEWDKFFQDNTWIFGHGLAYQFLNRIESQAQYGGATLSGSGGQRGDYLMSTEAKAKFTVLVEIKKPESVLVTGTTSPKVRAAF